MDFLKQAILVVDSDGDYTSNRPVVFNDVVNPSLVVSILVDGHWIAVGGNVERILQHNWGFTLVLKGGTKETYVKDRIAAFRHHTPDPIWAEG